MPTVTPSPSELPRQEAILVAPPGVDLAFNEPLGGLVSELAARHGFDYRTVSSIEQSDIKSGLKVVVVLPPYDNLAELAAAAPETRFIAFGDAELAQANNLTLISSQGAQADQQGFLAGYLAAVVTPDWRTGVINTAGEPADQAARQAFLNGVVFYCGLCRPAYPPFVQYPLAAELAQGGSPADEQAAADSLIAQGVTTVYLAPGADSPTLRDYLSQNGVNLIGGSAPTEALKPHWIATLQTDWLAEVRKAWEAAVSGQPYEAGEAPLAINDINDAILTEGRLRVVEQIRDELAAGLIDTGSGAGSGATP